MELLVLDSAAPDVWVLADPAAESAEWFVFAAASVIFARRFYVLAGADVY